MSFGCSRVWASYDRAITIVSLLDHSDESCAKVTGDALRPNCCHNYEGQQRMSTLWKGCIPSLCRVCCLGSV